MSSKIIAMQRLPDGSCVPLPPTVRSGGPRPAAQDIPAPAHLSPPTTGTPVARTAKSNAKTRRQSFHGTEPQHVAEKVSNAAAKLPTETITIRAKTATQRLYLRELQSGTASYIVAHGSAGGGKTYLAVLHAINEIILGNVNKLVITRPMIGAGNEELGFLPGDVTQKCLPWAIAVIDALEEVLPASTVAKMMETKQLEFAPLALMRGRTLKRSIVILDEAQNCSPEQVLTCLSRLGEGSRMVITGDERQHDLEGMSKSGLPDLLRRLERNPELAEDFSVHTFRPQDSVRHPAIEKVLHLYGQ